MKSRRRNDFSDPCCSLHRLRQALSRDQWFWKHDQEGNDQPTVVQPDVDTEKPTKPYGWRNGLFLI
jgi:hypothetical protein